ncbi:class I SAM-dependent methyltransferase [Streptomyces sp. T-3]|nr:class I SAM-dependent methyltransferase [Streptomyces sp. T-3]
MTTINDVQAAWQGSVGAHWAAHQDRYDALMEDFNEGLFAAAAIGADDRVLDVGCGAGATTRIAARLAAHGHATGVDVSAPLLDRAWARTEAEGLANASYELGDAQTYPFPGAGHDIVISRGGVMFFADHRAAFDNLARALRPGGRLAFICPQPAGPDSEEAKAFKLLGELAEDGSGPGPELLAAMRAMGSLAEPDRLREILAAYEDVSIAPLSAEAHWGDDPADAVNFILSRTPGRSVSSATRKAMESALEPYATSRGVRLRGSVWVVTAVRPR